MVDIETKLNRSLIKGVDIPISADTILTSGLNLVKVASLGQQQRVLALQAGVNESQIRRSTRSRYAMIGQEVQQLNPAEEDQIYVTNYTKYNLHLREGARLFRPFVLPGEPLKGLEIFEATEDKQIVIDGQEGNEWIGQYEDPYNRKPSNITGVYLRIIGERLKIEPSEGEVFRIEDEGNTRYSVAGILKKVKSDEEPGFWVSETTKIQLGAVDGLVSDFAPNSVYPLIKSQGFQIDSSIYDQERTNWRARQELFGPIRGSSSPNFVIVRFWPAQITSG